jgi:hypothetical protein
VNRKRIIPVIRTVQFKDVNFYMPHLEYPEEITFVEDYSAQSLNNKIIIYNIKTDMGHTITIQSGNLIGNKPSVGQYIRMHNRSTNADIMYQLLDVNTKVK